MSGSQPRVEAIGVKNGLIAVTGTLAKVEKSAGRRTRFLNLKDKTVLPGFIDTHVHPCHVGRSGRNVDLTSAESIREILRRIKQKIADTKPPQPVIGLNFNYDIVKEHRLPTRAELDELSAKHPVLILVYDVHSAMLNTRMLEILQIPLGMAGCIKNDNGEPTGLVEDPAIAFVMEKIWPEDEWELMAAVNEALQEALRVGITTLHAKEPYGSLKTILKHEKNFPLRLKPMFSIQSGDSADFGEILASEAFRQRAVVAFFADGAPDSKTAAFFEPYADELTNYGMLYYPDEELEDLIEKAHRSGFQVSVHTCGTRATEQVLNTYQKVLARHPRSGHRHRIEHFEMPLGHQIKRAVAMGIVFAMQPMFLFLSGDRTYENIRSLLGSQRVERWVPLRSILDAGGLVAGGSDAPVTRMSPLKGVRACVNHPNKSQRITLFEALSLFTVNGARIGFEEHLKGSIEAGKLADFAVLGDNPYAVKPEEVGDIKVEMTIVGGETVFSHNQQMRGQNE